MTSSTGERPRQDSNLRTWLRRPLLYPLSYEGGELTVPARPISLVAVASSGSCGDAGKAVIAAPLTYEGGKSEGTKATSTTAPMSRRVGKYDRRTGDALRVV